jgi:hypothetical protein
MTDSEAHFKSKASINAAVVGIVTVSTLIQCVALLGIFPIGADTVGRHVFSTVEMALVVLLLIQGWRIKAWTLRTGQDVLTQNIANLCFYSLVLCGIGDLVNRNYLEQYYQWDSIIKHSYLIMAIWFFFPGYLLIVVAHWQISRHRVSGRFAIITMLVTLAFAVPAFLSNYDPRVSTYASSCIFVYTLLLAVLAGSVLWVIKAYGWATSCIVGIGALLAPVADALIGNFWIYRDHFPVIEHVNWIIYFTSLAMIQQMPFMLAQSRQAT